MDKSTPNPTPNPAAGRGFVYLVGAGPGEADLLTLKGKRAVEQAEVIIYDRLVSSDILRFAQPNCERIFVGKSPGKHYRRQEEINELLIQKALEGEGKTVVRLKGGDPFVFGRGGEEALSLKERGIPFEVIPGVTSAIAVPAYAGIPVTHRGIASSFSVITGHEDPAKDGSSIAWEQVAKSQGTLIFLMAMSTLPQIVEQLVFYGKDAATPMAIIERGASPRQRTVCGTLVDIEALAREAGLSNPAIIVVGQVVSLRDELAWFEDKPLFGRSILVTRARHQASRLSATLANLGARVTEVPAIAFEPPEHPELLSEAVHNLSTYDWLVFTSANGVAAYFEELFSQGLDARVLAGLGLVALGPATKTALEQQGLRQILMPEEYYAEGVADMMDGHICPGDRVLLPRAEEARDVLPQELTRMGASVTEVAAYRTVAAPLDREALKDELKADEYDGITFTSSSTVHRLVQLLDGDVTLLGQLACYSIGPITSSTLREYGLEPAAQANSYCIEGLIEAIVAAGQKQEG